MNIEETNRLVEIAQKLEGEDASLRLKSGKIVKGIIKSVRLVVRPMNLL